MSRRNVNSGEVSEYFQNIADKLLKTNEVLKNNDKHLANFDVKAVDEGALIGLYLQDCLNENANIRRSILMKVHDIASYARDFNIIMDDYISFVEAELNFLDSVYPFVPSESNIGNLLFSMGLVVPEGFSIMLTSLEQEDLDYIGSIYKRYYGSDELSEGERADRKKSEEKLAKIFGSFKGDDEVPLIGVLSYATNGKDINVSDIAEKLSIDPKELKAYYEEKGYSVVGTSADGYIIKNSKGSISHIAVPAYKSSDKNIGGMWDNLKEINTSSKELVKKDDSYYYLIKEGDSLNSIAKKFGINTDPESKEYQSFLAANAENIKGTKIRAGGSLIISSGEAGLVKPTNYSSIESVNTYSKSMEVINYGSHIVEKGETLSMIAKQHDCEVDEILKLNSNIKNPDMINTDDEIVLPINNKSSIEPIEISPSVNLTKSNSGTSNQTEKQVQTEVQQVESNPQVDERRKQDYEHVKRALDASEARKAQQPKITVITSDGKEISIEENNAKIAEAQKQQGEAEAVHVQKAADASAKRQAELQQVKVATEPSSEIKFQGKEIITQNYVVEKGDKLGYIATKLGFSLDELKKANPQITNVDEIYPGQVIEIPKQSRQIYVTPVVNLNEVTKGNVHSSTKNGVVDLYNFDTNHSYKINATTGEVMGYSYRVENSDSGFYKKYDIIGNTEVVSTIENPKFGPILATEITYDKGVPILKKEIQSYQDCDYIIEYDQNGNKISEKIVKTDKPSYQYIYD